MRADSRPGAILAGALLIVVAGAALGVGYNVLARASRPPRGLDWVAREDSLPSLEAWTGRDSALVSPRPAAGAHPGAAPAADPGAAPAGAGDSSTMLAGRIPARGRLPVGAMPPAGSPLVRNPRPRPETSTPPASPPAAPAPRAVAAADLPAIPESDQPIQVQLPTFKRFFDARAAVVVDAREAAEYAQGHIAGARSLPADDASAHPEALSAYKGLGRPIVVYCSGPGCDLSRQLATLMLSEGIRKVLVFEGGFPAWQAAGYPIERGAAR